MTVFMEPVLHYHSVYKVRIVYFVKLYFKLVIIYLFPHICYIRPKRGDPSIYVVFAYLCEYCRNCLIVKENGII
jgi:hypothetical protein